jgi:hypothetical protein
VSYIYNLNKTPQISIGTYRVVDAGKTGMTPCAYLENSRRLSTNQEHHKTNNSSRALDSLRWWSASHVACGKALLMASMAIVSKTSSILLNNNSAQKHQSPEHQQKERLQTALHQPSHDISKSSLAYQLEENPAYLIDWLLSKSDTITFGVRIQDGQGNLYPAYSNSLAIVGRGSI